MTTNIRCTVSAPIRDTADVDALCGLARNYGWDDDAAVSLQPDCTMTIEWQVEL